MQSTKPVCPVCHTSDVAAFIDIPQMPVHCNLLWTSRAEALAAPRGIINLGFCQTCGHTFNMTFEPELMEYTQQYENSLHFSPQFQRYATSLAERLIEQYDLHNKDVVEIGSGKGEFLNLLCELGDNRGIGFDPSYIPDLDDSANTHRVTFIQDFYSERYIDHSADLVCCRHVLEHIQFPHDFLLNVRRAVGNRYDTVVFFEVPNALFMLRDLSVWDFIYEHCSYFCAGSLAHVFTACGFRPHRLAEEFGGQFLAIEARPADDPVHPVMERWEGLAQMQRDVARFAESYHHKVGTWTRKLEQLARNGKKAVLWGGGSKGVTFLNTIPTSDIITYVVDINPRKQGMYVAGSGQQIVSPAFLQDYRPDVVIVMNPLYISEIQQMLTGLGVHAEVIGV